MKKSCCRKKVSVLVVAVLASGILLTGCRSGETERIIITQPVYEKKVYETAEVCRGTLTPAISLTLHMQKLKYVHYSVTDSGLEVDKVAVSVGDKVKKGDLLVSFSSEEFQNTLAEYKEKDKQNELLIQHYRNLQKADKTQDHKEEIRELEQERKVLKLYIEETRKRIRRNQIRAKRDGTITEISASLKDGDFRAGSTLVTEACGTGDYVAEADAGETFKKGVTVKAQNEGLVFRMKLIQIKKTDGGRKKLYFRPLSDMSAVAEDAPMVVKWEKKSIRDCMYVDKRAVRSCNNKEFVYRMDDNGYYEAVEIETGNVVGDNIIITGGLAVGEKVRVE